ncbi:MAG: hypothetical protein NC825_01755 [Candidatus Omnitrophica bacterium]|nr:hypothetical protein [Candidatus Omnitrophota bacterium]
MEEIIKLKELSPDEVPQRLKVEFYFDFEKHPFKHQGLFSRRDVNSVVSVLDAIHPYACEWITKAISEKKETSSLKEMDKNYFKGKCIGDFVIYAEDGAIVEPSFIKGSLNGKRFTLFVGKGTVLAGVNIFLDEGDIYIGENNSIEPGVGIKGPTIIGNKNEIRQGTYLRGDVIIGDNGTFRGEIKNGVMMDKANFPHPSYVGDSICGYATHFGNQATTANLGIYAGIFGKKNVVIEIGEKKYDIGRPKIGIILGDFSQVGCNSVSDPGVFVGPNTIFYSLCRISKGFYGPNEVLKNKPMEHGVIERSSLRI